MSTAGRENTNVDAGEAVDREDFFHGGTVGVMKSFGQGVNGIGLESKGRICCANTQDGQTKLPKAAVGGGRHDPDAWA